MELEEALYQYFRFTTFRPGQKEIIESILSGQNTIAMLPTGTGKSLCYQLPGYMLAGQVLIISPLLSLMQDQVEQMKVMGEKRVIAINSFLTPIQKNRILSTLGRYKFIFVSPEMLGTKMVIDKLKKLKLSLLAIDEAHCISQWGYDFRPDYLKLGEIRKVLGNPLTIALTATATKNVRKDIAHFLEFDNWEEIVFSVDRPEIAIVVEEIEYREKQKRVAELAISLKGPGIIYFSSKKLADQTACFLRDSGKRAMAYHGGLEKESRVLIQQQFINGQLDVVCATSAFGMGINKENIRYVIHYHMPLQLESYLQEIGRAGRDGKESLGIMLHTPGVEQLSFQLAESELPEDSQIDRLFRLIAENNLNLVNLLDHQEMIITSCGFSETQWRIVVNFISSNATELLDRVEEKLKNYVEERLIVKRRNIGTVLNYLHHKGCKRAFILNYFAELVTRKPPNCCSFCKVNIDRFQKSSSFVENVTIKYDWKNELASFLLRQESESNEKK